MEKCQHSIVVKEYIGKETVDKETGYCQSIPTLYRAYCTRCDWHSRTLEVIENVKKRSKRGNQCKQSNINP